MFKFEELRVYKESLNFVDTIYSISTRFPKEETYGLSDQIKRAASSVVLNIAEGAGKTSKDFQHFLSMARGSCYECVAILTIVLNRKFIPLEIYKQCYSDCERISKMISALKSSLNSTHNVFK